MDARLGIPVLHQVQPALVPQENPGIELKALPLIVSKISSLQAERPLELGACIFEVPNHDAYVLDSQNRHVSRGIMSR